MFTFTISAGALFTMGIITGILVSAIALCVAAVSMSKKKK